MNKDHENCVRVVRDYYAVNILTSAYDSKAFVAIELLSSMCYISSAQVNHGKCLET